MEEIKHISEAVFNWAFRGLIAILTFNISWSGLQQRKINKISEDLAVNCANDESRNRRISKIEYSVKAIQQDVKTIMLTVQDQKEMFNATENRKT